MRTEYLLVGVIVVSILVMIAILWYSVKDRGCHCLEGRVEHLAMSNKMYDAVSITIFILIIMTALILLLIPAPKVDVVPIGAEAKYIPKNFHQISSYEDHLQNCKVLAP